MPALGPGLLNDLAAVIGWVGRTGGIGLSAIRLLHRRCLILRILERRPGVADAKEPCCMEARGDGIRRFGFVIMRGE